MRAAQGLGANPVRAFLAVFLPLSLEHSYDLESAAARIQKFVALDLPAAGTGEGEGPIMLDA